jgi:hypothetical protein
MVKAAAHLQDQTCPHLSVLKRLRYFMQPGRWALNTVLHNFLQDIARSLSAKCCPGGEEDLEKAALRIGAIVFIHRFGHNLNGHVNFHVVQSMGCLRKWRATTGLPGSGYP